MQGAQQPLIPGAPRRGWRTGAGVAAAVALAALACVAVTSWSVKTAVPAALYQIGDQEYLPMPSGSVEDTAVEVQKILNDESILLKKVEKRARKNHPVTVDIEAGQIGKRGRGGPVGYVGPVGFPGARGSRGVQGYRGVRGDRGITGIKGVKGIDGEQGFDGDKGNQGEKGPPGSPGRRGREGRRGKEGALGVDGVMGAFGTAGEMGEGGAMGKGPGQRGNPGPAGPPGKAGRDGDPGLPGGPGPVGPNGANGQDGAQGPAGITGPAGKSVCGIASTVGKTMCCGNQIGNGQRVSATMRYWDIDTSSCKFQGQPKYFASIKNGPSTIEAINIVDPTVGSSDAMSPTVFRAYVRSSESIDQSTFNTWRVQWCGLGEQDGDPKPYEMCCGTSDPKSWRAASDSQIRTKVDTRGCGWEGAYSDAEGPFYFASTTDTTCANGLQSGGVCASAASGAGSVLQATGSEFYTYLRKNGGTDSISEAKAERNNWQVNWCGVKKLVTTPDNAKAGYPCTSLRILQGGNSQKVLTNSGKLCCDASSAGGWENAGDGKSISKEVDISGCGFKNVNYVITNIRGDAGVVQDVRGGNTFLRDGDKFKVYIDTNNQVKFYRATALHWRVSYCVAGY
mmetsp:Transcript_63071/g.150489  ORF Transcript_63071/g.150489 Transcript_63071/m.150489 type:complete len:622 (-) Transcript_63071:49-1914(-)